MSLADVPAMNTAALDRLIAWFVAVVVVLRMTIGGNLLNRFVGYTTGTGNVLGRLHPGTYLLIIPVLLYLLRGRVRFFPAVDGAIIALLVATGVALSNGGLNAASVLVDTLLAAVLIARLVMGGSEASRTRLLRLMVAVLLINLPIIMAEKAMGVALIPRDRVEQFFRPPGLLDHPLTAGWTCCFVMWSVLTVEERRETAVFVNLLLLLEVALCSVRLPLLLAGLLFSLTLLSLGRRTVGGRLASGGAVLALLPALVLGAASLGLLDRFIDLGFYDNVSAASRLGAWSLLSYVNNDVLWHGMDNQSLAALLKTNRIEIVENSFVIFVLLCGVVPAVLAHLAVLSATAPAWMRSLSFLVVLPAMLLASISLSTKSAVVIVALVVAALYAARRRDLRLAAAAPG